MEGEILNFIFLWSSAIASLSYCHFIAKLVPKGTIRLITILPVIFLFLFLLLPLNLTTIHLNGPTSFFLTWLATFKLLLFAFDQPPLSSSLPLSQFLLLASLPIKTTHCNNSADSKTGSSFNKSVNMEHKIPHKSPINYATKALIFATFVPIYEIKEKLNEKMIMAIYSIHIYVGLEIILAVTGAIAQATLGIELEPTFDEPLFSSSLQDFWGRRWNLMVTSILRPTVYFPVRSISSRLIGRKLSSLLALVSVFLVSGLMHELIFYYIGRKKPTWELMCFFLLQGISLAVEIEVKKMVDGKLHIPAAISGPLAVGFVVVTGVWLFMPSFIRMEGDVMARREYLAFVESVGVFHFLRFKIFAY